MQIARRRSISDITRGFFFLAHPIPTALFLTTVAIFSVRALWPHLMWNVIILLVLGHATMQCSINMMNDYCDRYRDAKSQPQKPIVRGLVRPNEAFTVAVVMGVVMVLILLNLPPLALVISLGYLILGQGYNLGLKSTPFSGFILALMFALIPLYVFAGIGKLVPIAFWLVPVAFLLGAALNLANSLPDLEGDIANNAHTLTVLLGLRRSFLVCYLLMFLSATLIAILTLTHAIVSHSLITYALLVLTAVLLLAMVPFFGPNKPVTTRRAFYILIAVLSVILPFGWFLSVMA